MTDADVLAGIQSLHDVISRLQVAGVRGFVEPTFANQMDSVHSRIRSISGVPSLPGPQAGIQELVKWAVPALGALRAEQKRRLTG